MLSFVFNRKPGRLLAETESLQLERAEVQWNIGCILGI